jgi:hypothetical protein
VVEGEHTLSNGHSNPHNPCQSNRNPFFPTLHKKIDANPALRGNAAIGQNMAVITSVLLFPVDALYRTPIHRILDTFFRTTLGHDNLGLFFLLIKSENLRANLHTTFAADTFIGIDTYQSVHFKTPHIKFDSGTIRKGTEK